MKATFEYDLVLQPILPLLGINLVIVSRLVNVGQKRIVDTRDKVYFKNMCTVKLREKERFM